MVAMLRMEPVGQDDVTALRDMALAYWQELMPRADVLRDEIRRAKYFDSQFDLSDDNRPMFWAVLDNQRVGFINVTFYRDEKRVYVEDFYIVPQARRQGCGTALVNWLFAYLDEQGIEQIDLNVRRDNPNALAFWQAQGFGIAGYRLRQYRDPKTGTAFKGVLSSDFDAQTES